MKTTSILTMFLIIICNLSPIKAQELYKTVDGTIAITAVADDSLFILTSQKVLILLDYETSSFTLKVDKSTFSSGNDTIDQEIKNHGTDIVEFKGRLAVDYINPDGHPPLDFQVEGTLSNNREHILIGEGKLEHQNEGALYSCILSMVFHLKTSDLNIPLPLENLNEEIQIEIVQALLDRQKK